MIIDFRVRPPYKTYRRFFQDLNVLTNLVNPIGMPLAESIRQASLPLLIDELKHAGVTHSVLPGRSMIGVPNEELFEYEVEYPNQVSIFPFVDPLDGEQETLNIVEQMVINGTGKGIAIEPGVARADGHTYDFNDERAFSLYEKLEQHEIPLMITYSALAMPSIDRNTPYYLDQVAATFPKLQIVVAHGGWPWVRENIAIAFKRGNVYLIPDIYGIRYPGAQDFIDAANTILKERTIFGSSYPVLPVVESVAYYKQVLNPNVQSHVFYENAARLLKL